MDYQPTSHINTYYCKWREFIKEWNLDIPCLPPLKNATLCRAIKEVLAFPPTI